MRTARPLASLALLLAALGAPAPAPAEGDGTPPPVEEDREFLRPEVVVLEPFERKRPAGGTVRLKFTLKGYYRAPVLVVVGPDGASAYHWPDRSAPPAYEVSFRLDAKGGTHRVALAADGPYGIEYGARFRILATGSDGKVVDRDVDIPPPDSEYPPLDPDEDPLRLERILFHRMNGLRARQGLPSLPWHEGVARSARTLLPALARRCEETWNPKTGEGLLPHRIPGTGPGGTNGPCIGDLVQATLGWPVVDSRLAPARAARGRNQPNYVSESITQPSASLDRRFEQVLLRHSDHRAPMLHATLTHAAGAATWRFYGWKADTGMGPAPDTTAPPGPPPRGVVREAIATLVYVQANDPAAEEAFEKERRAVLRAVAAASKPEERAAALRALGRQALAESPRILKEALKSKDPEILAAALDGLWLCAPAEARRASDPMEVRVQTALAAEEEARAAEALRVLPRVKFDAASRKRALAAGAEIRKRAKAVLAAAERQVAAGDRDGARAALEAAAKRFAGYPEGEEAALAAKALEPPPAPR